MVSPSLRVAVWTGRRAELQQERIHGRVLKRSTPLQTQLAGENQFLSREGLQLEWAEAQVTAWVGDEPTRVGRDTSPMSYATIAIAEEVPTTAWGGNFEVQLGKGEIGFDRSVEVLYDTVDETRTVQGGVRGGTTISCTEWNWSHWNCIGWPNTIVARCQEQRQEA